MINNPPTHTNNNQQQLTAICNNFATLLYRTQNLQVATNYVQLISQAPNKATEKDKQHQAVHHWLQNIGDEKSAQLFTLSSSNVVEKLIGYFMKNQKQERYSLKETKRYILAAIRQKRQKRDTYLSSVKIAWLSAPLIIAEKESTLDMLRLFLGENYFSSTDCNCEINVQEKLRCTCLEKIQDGFQLLYLLAKQIKKNILNHYNNAHFIYKIKELNKIKEYAQNQLKYERKVLSRLFQMRFLALEKEKGVETFRSKGSKIENLYYQYQQKISMQILERLQKQQKQEELLKQKRENNKKRKNKVKKQQKKQKHIQMVSSSQKDHKQSNKTPKEVSLAVQQTQSLINIEQQMQKEAQIYIKSNDLAILINHQDRIESCQGNGQSQLQDMTLFDQKERDLYEHSNGEEEEIHQNCLVLDSSKIQTNSNTPSNSFLECISLSSDKEPYLNAQDYQIDINPQLQAQKINQMVITEIIRSKCDEINPKIVESYNLKQVVLQQITKCINAHHPYLSLSIFGSTVTGLALPNSDLDILINNLDNGFYQEPDLLKSVGKVLNKEYWVSKYQYVFTAKVPVIKLEIDLSFFVEQPQLKSSEEESRFLKVDITLNSCGAMNSGLQSTEFMQYILTYGPNLKQALLIIKMLLEKYNLHQNYRGGMNSYTIFIMMISYIQFSKINIYEKSSTFILVNMLKFYAEQFDYQQYVIRYEKDSSCFMKFSEYAQTYGNEPLERSGLLKIIDPVNNKLIKASYSQLNQIVGLFRLVSQTITNLRKKALQIIELLILQKNRVDNNVILKIGLETVQKSQESSRFLHILF